MGQRISRPFVGKLESGEYISKWRGYSPILIGGSYSDYLNIGEEKFHHCIGEFNGIGDVNWWIKEELDKLDKLDILELEWICKYKIYVKEEVITLDLITDLSKLFKCEIFHVYRTKTLNLLNFAFQLRDFYNKILDNSNLCRDPKTLSLDEYIFKIKTFREFKSQKIIFLDIDGVLNPWDNMMKQNHPRDEYGNIFETSCIEVFRKITESFSDKIVIISTWRLNGLEIMKEIWKKRNLPGEIIDVTISLEGNQKDGWNPWENKNLNLRGQEIEEWISRNPVDDYLIIDDCNQFLDHQQEKCLITDGDKGLRFSDALKYE